MNMKIRTWVILHSFDGLNFNHRCPHLVELAGFLLGQRPPVPMALGLGGAGIGPVAGLVLGQELVQVLF